MSTPVIDDPSSKPTEMRRGVGPRVKGVAQTVLTRPSAAIFVILAVVIVIFSALAPGTFTTVSNARSICTDASILVVIAVAQMLVIVAAGIDLSNGSVLVFSGVVSAKIMTSIGGSGVGPSLVGLVVAVACGLAWGMVNGFLTAYWRIPAFVVTLGTFGAALGLAYILSGGLDIQSVPSGLTEFGIGRVLGIPNLVIVAACVAAVFGVLLHMTRFGRHTYGIGSNAEAARRASINVNRHLVAIYALAGGLTGFAGFLSLARFGTTTLNGHATDNLQAVTAVVIGGTSLFGGSGSVIGSVAGVFIPTVLQNGFVVIGVVPYWQQVTVGAVLVVAVYLDQLRRDRNR